MTALVHHRRDTAVTPVVVRGVTTDTRPSRMSALWLAELAVRVVAT